jgi:hypothetical protein
MEPSLAPLAVCLRHPRIITNSSTVCRSRETITEIHEPANERNPVNPMTRHRARKSPMDRKVPKGSRKNLTKRVFLQCFQSSTHPTIQTARKIRLSGDAKKSDGNAHI